MLPIQLYRALASGQPALSPYQRRQRTSNTAATLSQSVLVDTPGRILLLTAMCCMSTPAAGQAVRSNRLAVTFPGDTFDTYIDGSFTTSTGTLSVEQTTGWSGFLYIPNGATLKGHAAFDSSVGANALDFSVFGVLIPLGNITQG